MTNNFIRGVGKLVVDRYDFQNHIDGSNFNHAAGSISLNPTVTIDSVVQRTVQSAIEAIANNLEPISLPEADTSGTKGIITLQGGDLAGVGSTSSSVRVSGIQGKPIESMSSITTGHVLTWKGSAWGPQETSDFSVGGDLTGSNTSQYVSSITGNYGVVTLKCNKINFNDLVGDIEISQDDTETIPVNMFIKAQSTSYSDTQGGSLNLNSGDGGSYRCGSVSLNLGNADPFNCFEVTQLIPGTTPIISLFNSSELTTTQMPTGTGSRVIYIHDTTDPPTTGSPVDGSVLYSYDGELWIKQPNGDNFKITNPSSLYEEIVFEKSVEIPKIIQESTTGTTNNMFIKSQSTSLSGEQGGDLNLNSGDGGGTSNRRGSVFLNLGDDDPYNCLEITQLVADKPILSLFNGTKLTDTEMGSGTGSKVIYIHDTTDTPITGSPNDGTILYSNSGSLWIKQSDGDRFQISEFEADGDLTGTNKYQKVVSIYGSSGKVSLDPCKEIVFGQSVGDCVIMQEETSITATDLSIEAQSTIGYRGGNLNLVSGYGDSSYTSGSVFLNLGRQSSPSFNCLEVTELEFNKPILSLFNSTELTLAQMPSGTGSKVIYIHDTTDTPTVSPVNGTILYSDSGNLWIKQSDGSKFKIKEQPYKLVMLSSKIQGMLIEGSTIVPFFTTRGSDYEKALEVLEDNTFTLKPNHIVKLTFNGFIGRDYISSTDLRTANVCLGIKMYPSDNPPFEEKIATTDTIIYMTTSDLVYKCISLSTTYTVNSEINISAYVALKASEAKPFGLFGSSSLNIEIFETNI